MASARSSLLTWFALVRLVPGIGEIIGGSQREDDIEKLEKRMDELGLKKEDYDFYLDLRKYGSTRHSGFGLGFERCVMYLTGMGNIRDVIPFPRTVICKIYIHMCVASHRNRNFVFLTVFQHF